jgi:hypothetical protein
LLDFLKKSLNSSYIKPFFEKKTTEKDTLKSGVYLGLLTYCSIEKGNGLITIQILSRVLAFQSKKAPTGRNQ